MLNWFESNHMQANPNKFQFIIFNKEKTNVPVAITNNTVLNPPDGCRWVHPQWKHMFSAPGTMSVKIYNCQWHLNCIEVKASTHTVRLNGLTMGCLLIKGGIPRPVVWSQLSYLYWEVQDELHHSVPSSVCVGYFMSGEICMSETWKTYNWFRQHKKMPCGCCNHCRQGLSPCQVKSEGIKQLVKRLEEPRFPATLASY